MSTSASAVCSKDCKNAAIAAKRSRAESANLSRNEAGPPRAVFKI